MRNIWNIFRADWRRLTASVVAVVVLLGLCLVPCLYAWFNILSNWDPYGVASTSRIKVAVASEDQGYQVMGLELNIGELVLQGLESNDQMGWVFVDDADTALSGVEAGEYYAALVVPEEFTGDFVSILTGDLRHPQIQYYENEKKNAIAPKITSKAKTAVQEQINTTVVGKAAEALTTVGTVCKAMGLDSQDLADGIMDKLTSARQETAQTQTTADTSTGFKHYEPGQLHYESDGITVSIEQKTKDGMTYFVCDIQLERVEQFRTAFAGDDFKSGIYEAVSDIAGRYNPVLAINADFCRYHRDGVIIRNGEVLRRQNIKKHHLLVVDQNGDLSAQTDRSGKQGLVANKLEQAKTELERMLEQIPESGCYAQQRLRNDTLTAYAVTLAALERKTSTGCHVRTDSAGEPEKYRVNIRCENGRAVPRRAEI